MPNTMQEYLASATQKAADDLAEAFLRLPEDKRDWAPDEKARTALDQVAECALLNGYTADLIRTRQWSTNTFNAFPQEKAEAIAQGWDVLQGRLRESAQRVIAAIQSTPDDALAVEIELPWRKQTLAEMLAYPSWNMTYHQGQINYIASILGCLD